MFGLDEACLESYLVGRAGNLAETRVEMWGYSRADRRDWAEKMTFRLVRQQSAFELMAVNWASSMTSPWIV